MPRAIDPGTIITGAGHTVDDTPETIILTGAAGPPFMPDIGVGGHISPDGFTHLGFPPFIEGGGTGGGAAIDALRAHLEDPRGAHAATAISYEGDNLLSTENVEGALDQIMGVIPAEPPTVGTQFNYMSLSGIPDWGTLKLADTDGKATYASTSILPGEDIYAHYHVGPTPPSDPLFPVAGADPATDPVWNTTCITVMGCGVGVTKAGARTKVDLSVRRTYRIIPEDPGVHRKVTVSGMAYPADRGVLAIIHWPGGEGVAVFLLQDLTIRCVAALLLGQGLYGEDCLTASSPTEGGCDGEPGGIFALGGTTTYDPFAFPGRATGQYDLDEIHTGLSIIDVTALPAPWDVPTPRNVNAIIPGDGQVRLGTDPAAGIPPDPIKAPYGIPILGATFNGYDPVTPPPDTIEAGAFNIVGHTILLDIGTGAATNYFRYRLPYLDDYTGATGLKFTPRGTSVYSTRETARYFRPGTNPTDPYTVVAGHFVVGAPADYLSQAGDYPNFDRDYWTWQVARYRHTFYVEDSDVTGTDLGTYWLVHFKTERDFEKLVRDGILPNDAVNGYEVYGAALLGTSALEDYDNQVNRTPVPVPPAGAPTAPDYGYHARTYHEIRSTLTVGAAQTIGASTEHVYTWRAPDADPGQGVVWTSGVAYFTPRRVDNGFSSFYLEEVHSSFPAGVWLEDYRVDDNPLTDPAVPAAPAVIPSPNPAFIGIAPFAFDYSPGTFNPTYTIPAGFTDARGSRLHRIEFPFTECGAFTEVGGPVAASTLVVDTGADDITFAGDHDYPAFTTNGLLRAFVRRPLAAQPTLPYAAPPVSHGDIMSSSDGKIVLSHSTSFTPSDVNTGHFGNFVNVGAGSIAYATLCTSVKDVQERFLDEIYRYRTAWNAGGAPGIAEQATLTGPGMVGWVGGPIPVPVRAGLTAVALPVDWTAASWTRNLDHAASLVGAPLTGELQVSGLPDRNPPIADWVAVPFPSAGLLRYPAINYSVVGNAYRPDDVWLAAGVQPDYSAAAGVRTYMRTFDAAFSAMAGTESFKTYPQTYGIPTTYPPGGIAAAGQPFFVIRIDGLSPGDFAYGAPGPGSLLSGIAIMIKVPGLTTWMDLGRADGAGPSKQDAALDGAGCQVIGPNTFEGVDPVTGMVFTQVKVNVGPAVTLALGQGTEVPVLVKVIMNDAVVAVKEYILVEEYHTPGNLGPVAGPGLAGHDVRGIVGISVVHPLDVQTV